MSQSDAIDLEVSHAVGPDDVVVALRGDLDVVSADSLGHEIEQLRPLPNQLVVDLSGVTFIDSSGLQALLAARIVALADTGLSLRLTGESPMTRRLLELTGLNDAFDRSDAEAAD